MVRGRLTRKESQAYPIMKQSINGSLGSVPESVDRDDPIAMYPFYLRAMLNLNDAHQSETAEKLGVSKAALGYMMLRHGVEIRKVALTSYEDVEIVLSRTPILPYGRPRQN